MFNLIKPIQKIYFLIQVMNVLSAERCFPVLLIWSDIFGLFTSNEKILCAKVTRFDNIQTFENMFHSFWIVKKQRQDITYIHHCSFIYPVSSLMLFLD
jgi:hypothetical protein